MAEARHVSVSRGQATARFVLRGDAAAAAAASPAAGVDMPQAINRFAVNASRTAMKLGPDEWLLTAQDVDPAAWGSGLRAALAGQAASLVDVSHRQIGLLITGAAAAEVLNGAAPLDLSLKHFPVGMATRTIFEKAEIVLIRMAADQFAIEVWRSFAPYVEALLAELAGELAGN